MTWISLIAFPICANDSNFLNSLTIAVLTSFPTYSTMHKEDYFGFVFKEGNWTSAKKYALKAENETHLVASVSLHISSSCRKLHHALWICHLSITLSNLKGSSLVSSTIMIGPSYGLANFFCSWKFLSICQPNFGDHLSGCEQWNLCLQDPIKEY